MSDTNPKVEHEVAFAFTCPRCKQRNYVEGAPHEFDAEEQAEITEFCDGKRQSPGDWIACPEEAQCGACGLTIELVSPAEAGL